jgi:hypothetical protein
MASRPFELWKEPRRIFGTVARFLGISTCVSCRRPLLGGACFFIDATLNSEFFCARCCARFGKCLGRYGSVVFSRCLDGGDGGRESRCVDRPRCGRSSLASREDGIGIRETDGDGEGPESAEVLLLSGDVRESRYGSPSPNTWIYLLRPRTPVPWDSDDGEGSDQGDGISDQLIPCRLCHRRETNAGMATLVDVNTDNATVTKEFESPVGQASKRSATPVVITLTVPEYEPQESIASSNNNKVPLQDPRLLLVAGADVLQPITTQPPGHDDDADGPPYPDDGSLWDEMWRQWTSDSDSSADLPWPF